MSKFPASNPGQSGTENRFGIMKFANATEAADANNDSVAISPKRLASAPAGTTSRPGPLELSTDAEAVAKTDSERAITPSNLASSGFLQYADVTITSAEILLLATTPKELVAAPAAGSKHLFMGMDLKLNYGTNVFTEAADNLVVKYTDASGVAVSEVIECTGFIDQAADTITNGITVKDNIVAASAAEAKALVLDNTNANFGGNAAGDNTLTVRTYYVTHAL